MAKSNKGNKAYHAWKKVKALKAIAPSKLTVTDRQKLSDAWQGVQVVGWRYGNKRKSVAKRKVQQRQVDRQKNKALLQTEVNDAIQ